MNNIEYNYEFDGDLVSSISKIFNSLQEQKVDGQDDGFPSYTNVLPPESLESFISEIENNLNSKLFKQSVIKNHNSYSGHHNIVGYYIGDNIEFADTDGLITHFKIYLNTSLYNGGALDEIGVIALEFKMLGKCIKTQ